ncbi:GDP-mannose 4,6-dehydratase [Robbsia sp. Bb-Pol-6]|uniref:GDP-mannose 4,6-dehydratase n=1 Tax=Robbsia betulipollinis TaxID=2981849 RepID=A0ABT3ZLY1_9BURK|nr:NAD-dependent epimerase/dehydratase family protein [Robbsia betulipollinis]MCY0387553.1 GDP-mannose 4,6-dehydratase [Robbsia betulipollinis]
MRTALVTGASGFTGQYMVRSLKEAGYVVVGLGSSETAADEMVACDLTDADAINAIVARVKPDVVVHLAALAFVGHDDQKAFYHVNIFGTQHLLNAVVRHVPNIEKVLIASSANVYGTPGIESISEDVTPRPVNHYACSKLAMECIVATYFEKLPIIITRPFNYTGPGQAVQFLIPKIVSHFVAGRKKIELGNIDVSRDFSDVRDLVGAYTRLLTSAFKSGVINICSGEAMSLSSIIAMMEEIAGYPIQVEVNPAFVRANEIPVLKGDPGRLAAEISLPPRIAMRQTLSDMYHSAPAAS